MFLLTICIRRYALWKHIRHCIALYKSSCRIHSVWFITVFWFSFRVQNPSFCSNFQGSQPLIWPLFLSRTMLWKALFLMVFYMYLALFRVFSNKYCIHNQSKILISFLLKIRQAIFWKFLSLNRYFFQKLQGPDLDTLIFLKIFRVHRYRPYRYLPYWV